MTAPDTPVVDQTEAESTASDDVLPISDEELTRLEEGLHRAAAEQPTMHLLDVRNSVWYELNGTQHVLEIDGHHGLFDPDTALFTPVDPEPIRELLVQRLTELHGEEPLDAAGTPRAVDWSTVWIADEGGGKITADAMSMPDADGSRVDLGLEIDVSFAVTITSATTAEVPVDELLEEVAAAEAPEPAPEPAAEPAAEGAADAGPAAEPVAEDEEPAQAAVPADRPADRPAGRPAGEDAGEGADGVAEEQSEGGEAGEITAADLQAAYGELWFEFEGRSFQLGWAGWAPDGDLRSTLDGTDPDGARYELDVRLDMQAGPIIERAAALDADAATDETDGETDEEEITAADLAGNYGDAEFELDGTAYTIDWDSWETDQRGEDGLIGSPVPGTTEDGSRYQLYVWFDPAQGPWIESAELVEAAEPDEVLAAEAAEDPAQAARTRFDDVVCQELHNRWSSDGKMFTDASSGVRYDVSSWIDGGFDGTLEYAGYDEQDHLYATLGALTTDDEPRQVLLHLRIADADQVWVEREESR